MLKLPDRQISVTGPQAGTLSEAESSALQAHMEAMILTMDRLGVSGVELQAFNVGKNGGKFTLMPLDPKK